jgi:heterodisulfide reductase subunit C
MEKKEKGNYDLIEEISSIPGGEKIKLCIQCGTCTASCPNANKMDYAPRQIIAMARAGMREEVLSSKSQWLCLSCYLCTVRCPRGIKPTNLMRALGCISMRHGISSKKTTTPKMYRIFSKLVRDLGNVPEMGLMMRYYLATNPFNSLKLIPEALSLLSHGRLSPKIHKMKPHAKAQFKAILDKAESISREKFNEVL